MSVTRLLRLDMKKEGVERGVYYRHSDYCGVGRRFVVDLIDTVAATALWIGAVVLLIFLYNGFRVTPDTALGTFILVWFAYFVGLKGSPLRTLGYRLGNVKIVDLRGEAPTFLAYCERFLFSVLGPFNFVIDLLWLSTDPCGQSIRDKFGHAYVVRAGAEPLGWGRVVYTSYHIMGWNFLFAEVQPVDGEQA